MHHIYNDFNTFMGKLIHDVMSAAEPPQTPQMPAELAVFWKAAGDVFGFRKLIAIVRATPEILSQLERYTDRPLDDIREAQSNTATHLAFTTALNDFSKGIPLGATGAELQTQFTHLLERLEEDYNALKGQQFSPEDHKEEVDELFLRASYNLTRIQR